MRIDGKWVERNLGFNPATRAEAASPKKPEDFQREIIDFDSEGPEGREFLAFSTATGGSRMTTMAAGVRCAVRLRAGQVSRPCHRVSGSGGGK